MTAIGRNFFIFSFSIFLILFIQAILQERYTYKYSKIPTRFKCEPQKNHYHHHEEKYITLTFKTIRGGAGLGNQLFEIFALLGMARTLGRVPFFNEQDPSVVNNLGLLLETVPKAVDEFKILAITNRSLATVYRNSPACCMFEMHPLLKCETYQYVIIDGFNFQSFKYFENLKIRDFFTPSPEQKLKIDRKIKESSNTTCIHYQRGDFLLDNLHEGTNGTYLKKSIEFLRENYSTGSIYIFGNDPKWVQDLMENNDYKSEKIHIMNTPMKNALEDLHFSHQFCESVIITAPSSTFGWFMGYLSKNQRNVYYRDIYDTMDLVKHQMISADFYPPIWKILKF